MKIIVLTSSRADYGIYLPLLKKLKADSYFQLKVIAFGTHLSLQHGHTLDEIIKDGFEIAYKVDTLPKGDNPKDLAESMALTLNKFASIWESEKENIDLIFCLGDRYEMFAAISAAVPFNLPIAHLHGGETTIGAIDNSFRHSITSMSKFHFVSTEQSAKRVSQITNSNERIYTVGAMSLDNLNEIQLLSKEEFNNKFGVLLNNPILVTFHPETIAYQNNEIYFAELLAALSGTQMQIIITMPNADTGNELIRQKLQHFVKTKTNAYAIESLGTQGYFSCIEYSSFLLGNSSSGIIEAASFGKYVIDIGNRQKGREAGKNIIHCDFKKDEILDAIEKIETLPDFKKENIYGDGQSSKKIISLLKTIG